MQQPRPRVEVRRASDRFATTLPWLESKHSFSFGRHYDPANTAHGLLLVNNDDVILPGAGFETHPHRDMEIVTWVLQGSLVHQDSTGTACLSYPGLAQRMSAGSGIVHSETNDSWRLSGARPHDEPVRYVQMWVVPDERGGPPDYRQQEVPADELAGSLVPVASGLPRHRDVGVLKIRNRSAALYAARLDRGQSVVLPDAPYLHLFVAAGAVHLSPGGPLLTGDAVRFTATGGRRVTGVEPAEILVWEMHASLATA